MTLQEWVDIAIISLNKRLEQIGGCGDGGCAVCVRPGMHTNGGCRCLSDSMKAKRVVNAYKCAIADISKPGINQCRGNQ